MTNQDIQIYTDRDTFLNRVVTKINETETPDIFFSKFSPAVLPASGELIQAIYRNTSSGGRFFFVVGQGLDVNEWLGEVIALFSNCKNVQINLLGETTAQSNPAVPALVIGDTDIFLHLAWPTSGNNSIPYIGIHISGTNEKIQNLSGRVRNAIFNMAKEGTKL